MIDCDYHKGKLIVPNVPIPYKKLYTFRQWLGLTDDEMKKNEPLKDSFSTGFGVAIARQAVRKNMGRLSFEPIEEEDTRVLLSLPRCN
jgi:hypothetical protein